MTRLLGLFPPAKKIGENYLERWHLVPRNKWLNIFLHKFSGSDDDRACHDHPWWSLSLLLSGRLDEVVRVNGSDAAVHHRRSIPWLLPMARRAIRSHRLILLDRNNPAWTLFITGPEIREWGFWCPRGWQHSSTMTDRTGKKIGGCE